MSHVHRRTFPTRAAVGGKSRRKRRLGFRATARFALHKVNPPGTKLAKRMLKVRGLPWSGEVIHSGALTLASENRARARLGFPPVAEPT